MARLISIQTGVVQDVKDAQGTFRTGIFKTPVSGPVRVGKLGLEGDAQADRRLHGGPEKAVLAYCADNFPLFEKALGLSLRPGSFGENLTLEGLTEADVCIGDVYRVGTAELSVCQPRPPCWKLARKLGEPKLPKLVIETLHPGYYFQVLQEGVLEAGGLLELLRRPYPSMTVERCARLLWLDEPSRSDVEDFAQCDALPAVIRQGAIDALAEE